MNEPYFAFAHHHASHAVIVTLRGQWTMPIAESYMAAVVADMQATPRHLAPRNALFDIRDCGLLVRGVADAMVAFRQRQIGEMERIAIVSTSALDTFQARRITAARETMVFETLEPAHAWLAEPRDGGG